ncbi:hypothetical protein ABI59_01075 [Acidobacteria bacterium Mor1]|nr:hypothetical protein ABI59_01075 [Acidobacteria bacterium Mor1]
MRFQTVFGTFALLIATVGGIQAADGPAFWPEGRPAPFIAEAGGERTIHLQAGTFDTARIAPGDLQAALPGALRGTPLRQGGWAIVQFGPDVPAARMDQLLRSIGAEVGPAVPRRARLARIPAGAEAELRGMSEVVWAGRYHPGLRMSPYLSAPAEGAWRLRLSLSGHGTPALQTRLAALGIEVDDAWGDGMYVSAPDAQSVVSLARLEEVLFIEPFEDPRLLNDSSRGITQTSEVGNEAVHLHGVRGSDEIVTVMDSGIDVDHCCFDGSGKIVDNRAWGGGQLGAICNSDHGTHVSGTVACANGGDHDGLAPDADIILQDIQGGGTFSCLFGSVSPPSPLSSAWSDARGRGSFIHTNSWGGGGNSYGGAARNIDSYMWETQDFLILFAAGNGGSNGLGSYSNAKNSITVGGTRNGSNMENMYGSSSRGPAGDGRTLPDLTAPAQGVSSALNRTSCGWTGKTGTSMATPAAAGGAALVREYYNEGWYPSGAPQAADEFTPSAALIKATMLASTRDMTSSGAGDRPNSDQGYGRLTLDDSLWFPGDPAEETLRVLDDRNMNTGFSASGESHSYEMHLTGNEPLNVVLTWTDAPAASGASRALINDLDLLVTTADGRTFRGNQGTAGGWTVAESDTPDTLNNKEAVWLEFPYPGPVTITVEATDIVDVDLHPQDYALVTVAPLGQNCAGLAAPSGIGETLILDEDGTDVSLNWGESDASYTIYRGNSGSFMQGQPETLVDDLLDPSPTGDGVAFTDAGAAGDGGDYYYLVFGNNACGETLR